MATKFERTLADVDKRCRKHGIPYAVIGGIATVVHGYLRTTQDVDISIMTEIEKLNETLAVFSDKYHSIEPDSIGFFQRKLFVPLRHNTTRVRVDVTAALSGFERLALQRSKRLKYGNVEISVCTIEDLIIMKLVAARAKDTADLEVLVPMQRKDLDVRYLRARAREFIEVERSDVVERLEEFLRMKS